MDIFFFVLFLIFFLSGYFPLSSSAISNPTSGSSEGWTSDFIRTQSLRQCNGIRKPHLPGNGWQVWVWVALNGPNNRSASSFWKVSYYMHSFFKLDWTNTPTTPVLDYIVGLYVYLFEITILLFLSHNEYIASECPLRVMYDEMLLIVLTGGRGLYYDTLIMYFGSRLCTVGYMSITSACLTF